MSFSSLPVKILSVILLAGLTASCGNNLGPSSSSNLSVSDARLLGEDQSDDYSDSDDDYSDYDYGTRQEERDREDRADARSPSRPSPSRSSPSRPSYELDVLADSPRPAQSSEALARQFAIDAGDRVFFTVASSRLSADAHRTIAEQAAFLNDNPELQVTIEGHCDERGTREYNLALGLRRANALKNALVAAGVEPARMSATSYGKERPVAACSRERCWKVNRRAVVVIHSSFMRR